MAHAGYARAALLAARQEVVEGRAEEARQHLEGIAGDLSTGARVRSLALNDLAVMAFAADELRRARVLLEASLALDDGLACAHLNLGLVLESLHRPHEALAALRAALWCDPGERAVAQALDRIGERLGRAQIVDAVLAETRDEHRLIVATEPDLGFLRNDFHPGRRSTMRALYRRLAATARLGRVLEWDCGTGVGSAWMAEAGCRVLGVCRTPEALAYARRQHEHRGVRYVQDMDQSDGTRFDLVVTRAPEGSLSRFIWLGARVAPGGRLVVPSTWPAENPLDDFRPGETVAGLPAHLPGCTQRFVVWARERSGDVKAGG